ncbi:hypothetical protein ES708_11781 [subsurface metagenome]
MTDKYDPGMKKFFLISQVFYPDEVSTAGLFTSLCSYVAEEQIEVEVWCAHPSYTETEKQPGTTIYQGIEIHYLPSTHFHKRILIGRLINYLTFMVSVIVKLLITKDKTPIFTHTTPPSLGIVISCICSMKRRKFVYLLLDIFPDGLIRLGKVSAKSPLIRLWRRMNVGSLKRSYKIIVIGRDMQEWIGSVYRQGIQKMEYIPLWQDDQLISPGDYYKNALVRKYGLQDKFVVQYSGNMGLWNEMECIAQVVNRVHGDVFFLFVGGGMREREFYNSLDDDTHKDVLLLPFQPIKQLNESLTACHVGLVSLKEGLEGMAVPSKLYGIMAAGIPVLALAPLDSEIARVVEEENCGMVVLPTDIEALVQAILKLKSDEQLREEMGENGRKAFLQKYTTSIQARKYISLLDSIVEQ